MEAVGTHTYTEQTGHADSHSEHTSDMDSVFTQIRPRETQRWRTSVVVSMSPRKDSYWELKESSTFIQCGDKCKTWSVTQYHANKSTSQPEMVGERQA